MTDARRLHEAAKIWRDAGFGPYGAIPDKKCPRGKWRQYQQQPASVDMVTRQLEAGDWLGLVLLPGQEVIDIEGRAVDEGVWGRVLAAAGDAGLIGLLMRVLDGYHEVTPSGGIHTFWRCEAAGTNQPLARRPAAAEELAGDPDQKTKVLIETRGHGGFIVTAPSPGYEWQDGSPASIVTVTPEERDDLLSLFRSFDEMPMVEQPVTPPSTPFVQPGTKHHHGQRVGDDYNARVPWADVLTPRGWTYVQQGSRGESLWRRPGKSVGWSATTNATGKDTLIVHSTSTPFEIQPRSYDKFAAYALLNHDRDFGAAAKDLAAQGYGDNGSTGTPGHAGSADSEADSGSELPRRVHLTPASSIKPRPVKWLWQDRIPAGHISVTPGRGGIGKSTFHTWLIAQLTTGQLPGIHYGSPRPCVIAATEDSWAHTIVPRLMAAGANRDLVYRADVVTTEGERVTLSLPADTSLLEREIKARHVVLLSIDPLMSTIHSDLNSHNDRDVRQALEPLGTLADRTECVVLGNAHFNKGQGSDPMALIMGSAAFGNVPRAVLGFARDDKREDGSCVISQVKNNLGRLDLPSLRYTIESLSIDTDEGPAEIGRLIIHGESDRTVADILQGNGGGDSASKSQSAKSFLTDRLGKGVCTLSKDLEEEAREVLDISTRTLKAARQELKVVAHQVQRKWYLRLPGKRCTCDSEGQGATVTRLHPDRGDDQ